MINPLPWLGVALVFVLAKLWPQCFETLFLINIWCFSLPHTFSTFTRSDRLTRTDIAVTVALGLFFLVSVTLLASSQGMVLVYGFYFLWQQYHYTKQNFGIARRNCSGNRWDKIFYLGTTTVILLSLLADGPQNFFGYALINPFPFELPKTWAMIILGVFLAPYVYFRKGLLPAAEHVTIFSLSYLSTEHFALGWLLLNVFHNLQYLSFMKLVEKKLNFLILPVLLTGALFFLQHNPLKNWIILSIPLNLGLMLALNFTHYTLDGLIWRRKRN